MRRCVALLPLIVALVAPAAQAQPKALDNLTVDDIKARVGDYLKGEGKKSLPQLEPLVQVGVAGLSYVKQPPVFTVVWNCRRVKAEALTEAEAMQVRTTLEGMLTQALRQSPTDLVRIGEGQTLRYQIGLVDEAAQPATPRTPQQQRDSAASSESRGRSGDLSWAWALVPCATWCQGCCCWCGHIAVDYYWMPILIEGAESGQRATASARLPQPTVERAARPEPASKFTAETALVRAGAVRGGIGAERYLDESGRMRARLTQPPPVLDVARYTPADAPLLYSRGYSRYWEGEYETALAYLDAAAKLGSEDARCWYFKGLTELAMGKADDAQESLRRAVELHKQNKPRAEAIALALERVQGPIRSQIRDALEGREVRFGFVADR